MNNNAVGDMPTIGTSTYAQQVFNLNQLGGQAMGVGQLGGQGQVFGQAINNLDALRGNGFRSAHLQRKASAEELQEIAKLMEVPVSKRLVRVFISDPNPNLSLDDCLLYRGSEHLTDSTDQELYFELNIKELLDKHNAKRVKVVDKSIKDRTEYLEPVKIRDLRMVVVEIATF